MRFDFVQTSDDSNGQHVILMFLFPCLVKHHILLDCVLVQTGIICMTIPRSSDKVHRYSLTTAYGSQHVTLIKSLAVASQERQSRERCA